MYLGCFAYRILSDLTLAQRCSLPYEVEQIPVKRPPRRSQRGLISMLGSLGLMITCLWITARCAVIMFKEYDMGDDKYVWEDYELQAEI